MSEYLDYDGLAAFAQYIKADMPLVQDVILTSEADVESYSATFADYAESDSPLSASSTIEIDGHAHLQLAPADGQPMPLWAWGDFILHKDSLLNYSTGERTIIICADTATKDFQPGDQITIRTEGATLTVAAASKQATDSGQDSSGSQTFTMRETGYLQLAVPRSAYIKQIALTTYTPTGSSHLAVEREDQWAQATIHAPDQPLTDETIAQAVKEAWE